MDKIFAKFEILKSGTTMSASFGKELIFVDVTDSIDPKYAEDLLKVSYVTELPEGATAYKVVYRPQFGYHLEAPRKQNLVGPMYDGVYALVPQYQGPWNKALSVEERFPEVVRVHDRFETQEMYNTLSS